MKSMVIDRKHHRKVGGWWWCVGGGLGSVGVVKGVNT